MSFFIQIKGHTYKIPNQTIIGRGEPFTVLNSDWDVARSHLLMIQNDDKFYIQDLGSESGTYINREKLIPHKKYLITPEDEIQFGGQEFRLLYHRPEGEFTEIFCTKTSLRQILSSKSVLYFFLILYTIFFCFSNGEKGIFYLIASLIIFLFVFVVMFGVVRFFKKFLPNADLRVREIFYTQNGFTVHFNDGKNMSFKSSEIQSWFWHKRFCRLSLQQYDEDYVLGLSKDFIPLVEYLKSEHPEKMIKPEGHRPFILVILMTIHSICSFMQFYKLAIMFAFLVAAYFIIMIFNEKIRQRYMVKVSKMYTRRMQTQSLLFMSFLFLSLTKNSFDSLEMIQEKKRLLGACYSKDAKSCREIDFHILTAEDISFNKKDLKLACRYHNKSACYYLRGRDVAGRP